MCNLDCTDCCIDGLSVFEIEADRIRDRCGELLTTGVPHPEGACAFLDPAGSGACRIYAHRPYVCRTQGLPLRWLDGDDDDTVERRDICPLNEAGPAIESLPDEACWTLGPYEGRLATIQSVEHGRLVRVALRGLFAKTE